MTQNFYQTNRFLRVVAAFMLIFTISLNFGNVKAAPQQANNATVADLGGININLYCQSQYSGSSVLLDQNNPYSWRCKKPDATLVSLDLNKVCVWQYVSSIAYAKLYSPSGPYNWHCEKDVPINTTIYVEVPSISPSWTTNSPPCNGTWNGWYSFPNNRGYLSYLTSTAPTFAQSTNSATWTPNLPVSGRWRVEMNNLYHSYYTWPCLGRSLPADTSNAVYQISYSGGFAKKSLDQQNTSGGGWADLGTYNFASGRNGYVFLNDFTGEDLGSKYILFSALRFVYVGP